MNSNRLSLLMVGLVVLVSPWAFATTYSVDDYYDAKLEVRYEGEVGLLAQNLAQQLHIPYYTYQAEVQQVINVQQDETHSLSELISIINKQLPHSMLSVEKVNDQITLVLEGKRLELKDGNYIGKVVMANPKSNTIKDGSGIDSHTQTTVLSEDEIKAREKEAEKIKSILEMSKDKKLIQKYSRRKQPEYKVENEDEKNKVGLEAIKSTKISTFLVFKEGINLKDYQIKGDFQDFAKLENVAVILHRQKRPPMTITIITPEGYETILKY